jgi:hypothetical protein
MIRSNATNGDQGQSRRRLWRRRGWAATALLAALPLSAGTAAAFIVNVAPAVVKIPGPPSVLPGVLTGADIHAFDERQDFRLPAPLLVDHQGGNLVNTPGDVNPAWIPAGTCVRSHYVDYDPAAVVGTATGALQFEGEIVGVIFRPPTLDASNGLGAAFTAYPPNAGAGACLVGTNTCGLEITVPTQDSFQIVGDVLRVSFVAGNPGDRLRVITKSCACDPEPNQPTP